jgi:hypothetical protein
MDECLLRLSMPRFLEPFIGKNWEFEILREIFLEGCLNK